FARAGMSCMMVSLSAVFLFMSPTLLELFRRTFISRYVLIEKNIHAHKIAGYSFLFWAIAHVATYYYIFNNVSKKSNGKVTLTSKLFGSMVGKTGHAMVFLIAFMFVSAIPVVRRKFYEVFYWMHHLFVPIIIILFVHGSAKSFQWYIIGPGAIYTIDRVYRLLRSRFANPRILSIIQHPSNVIELKFDRRGMKFQVGQFIYLCVPSISGLEWHPFTLTSAPEEDELSVHIWIAGDWTRKLVQTFQKIPDTQPLINLPTIMIDGPYGAPTQQVFDYEHVVLVAGGIGVTPMSSVLKSLYYQVTEMSRQGKIKKVYFLWVCRDIQALEWFQDLLVALDEEDIGEILEIRTYLTGQLSVDQIRNIALYQDPTGPDAVTGLYRSPTYYGRPNFDTIFENIGIRTPGADIGVFFCGPKLMGRSLRKVSRKWSNKLGYIGTKFTFHKENF
ncbi:ferric reductase NAD binding domain-containing protein, partial [Kickxella alabastrina]|uniref:ferric reductase NAD binding domain-containing protein n=1 Tax=Kickxella alabastrina TaxID=61397 RepID=UPI00221F24BE